MPNTLGSYGFPDSYYDIVAASSSVKYVSASGSNSNNGDTATTPYLTIAQALSATSATSTTVTIVIFGGEYNISAVSVGTGTVCINDGGKPRLFVCAPGEVIINCTDATGSRDFAPMNFTSADSAIYGAIITRNNGARTTAYSTAFFNDTTAAFNGKVYNTVFKELNTNNTWAIQYDNENNSTGKVYNSTFYNNANGVGDYSGSTGFTITDTVFNTTVTTSATKTNVLQSQSVNSTTYVTTGVTTAGVYSGTYAWNGTISSGVTSIVATGGTIETTMTNGLAIKKHTFTTSGSFTISSIAAGDTFDYIVVGGGGGGTYNNYVGSGGGGAAVNYGNANAATTTYTVTIGSGGAGKSGGGYGGGANGTSSTLVGGVVSVTSGGGPGSGMNGNPDATGVYTYGVGSDYRGAGAGGAGQAGQGSNGGNGKLITSGVFSTNTTYYGGGGAGGLASASGLTSLSGGLGGGANTTLLGGQPATTNSGGGGAGGSANQNTTASSGASGVVIIAYYTSAPDGIFSSSSTVVSGANVTITLYSSTTGNVPYTITGITSNLISNASLTGNFVMNGSSGQVTFTVSPGLTSTYTMSIAAESYSTDVLLSPNVTISTSIIGVSGSTSSSYLENPVDGQMEIPKSVTANLNYSTSSTPLVSMTNRVNAVEVSYTTITNSIAGPISAGVIKVFGDIPQREYWL